MSGNFRTVVVCDFEYEIADGDLPFPLCVVAYVLDSDLRHVRTIRLWRGEFGSTPPFDIGRDALFVGYSCWAEMTCFKVLGWRFPVHIFDQHTAYLAASNILLPPETDVKRKREKKRLPMPAALTVSRVGSASTRTPWRKLLVRDAGENSDRRGSSITAKRM